ncbi:MAG: glycosyltransferase, partial [Lachnospiraceae bacterium]|nr:glycosyltransferase [Lachnospiraceae bacterium]
MSKCVNVLISAYNGKKYIKEQIDSILAQQDMETRIFVRDDGSSDGTPEYVRSLYPEDKVQLIQGNNLKHGGSFYELTRLAEEGDYWAFSDQDDIWLPGKLKKAVDWMESQETDQPLLYHSAYECRNEDLS